MKPFFVVLGYVFVASTASAASEFVPVQERAQGQSLAGSNLLNDSIHSNPAGSAFTNTYTLDATYQFPKSMAVSVLDTKTSGFGGSLGYFRTQPREGGLHTQGGKIGLSGILAPWIGIGATGKMIWGPNRSGGGDKLTDVDAGVLLNFNPFNIGLSMRNLIGGNEAMAMQREWALGARYGWQNTMFISAAMTGATADGLRAHQYSVGMEYMSPYYFGLKGGFRYNTEEPNARTYWSLGASINSPRLSFHYAAEFPRQPQEPVEHVLSTSFQL